MIIEPHIPKAAQAELRSVSIRMGRVLRQVRVPRMVGQPLIVSDGLGTDSQAALIVLHRAGIRPDLIMFADPGGEMPHTYAYLDVLRPWLQKVGFPELTIVRKHSKLYTTLYDNCIANSTLPSLAFGRKGCSQKWKVQVMDQWVRQHYEPAHLAWRAGMKCLKVIGYDASPADCRRSKIADDEEYQFSYPLRDSGIKRDQCMALIESEGLAQPGKSACFFCPATKKPELVQKATDHPELVALALLMEAKAEAFPGNERRPIAGFLSTKGLGRNWNWREYLERAHPAIIKRLLADYDCGQAFMPAALANRATQPERLAAARAAKEAEKIA